MKTQIETLIPELNQTQPNSSNHEELIEKTHILTAEVLHKRNAYWRAANYLSVGRIYLYDNPLLKESLKLSHVKPLVVGHGGTRHGQNFIYVHLCANITSTSTAKTCRRFATGNGGRSSNE